ncbi:ATP-binding protein, partial [Saccharothrix sp. Mg75]|uniref:ATP-binding protein n=1 Tax=Saccharothrix sp. Mg75 TaxID=3445357 RepID=UPI003EEAF6E1
MTDQLADHHWGVEFPAQPGRLAAVRAGLDGWLAASGLTEDDRYDLLIAVNEAASNAVEHAYPHGDDGVVHIDADARPDGSVRVVVTDYGTWRVPPAALTTRGRGLLLMHENVDDVLIDRQPTGTTVTLVLAARRTPRGTFTSAPREPVVVTEREGWVEVVVRGDVPAQFAPAVRRRILAAARGGTVPVVVDLRDLGRRAEGLIRSLRPVAEA